MFSKVALGSFSHVSAFWQEHCWPAMVEKWSACLAAVRSLVFEKDLKKSLLSRACNTEGLSSERKSSTLYFLHSKENCLRESIPVESMKGTERIRTISTLGIVSNLFKIFVSRSVTAKKRGPSIS